MKPLTIGVDASFVTRDRRGMGRCIRNILQAWKGHVEHRLVLLCYQRRHLSTLEEYAADGWEVHPYDKSPPLDVCWFPWNRVDWPCRYPAVVQIHDVAPFTIYHPETRHLEEDQRRLLQATERADLVITGSNHTRSEIHRYLEVEWDRMHVVYMATDSPFTADPEPGAEPDQELLARVGDLPFLLFVGNLEPRKNLQGLLEAYHLLAQRPKLVVVCPKPTQSWSDKLRGKVAPLLDLARSLEDRCLWLEAVDDVTLAQLYRTCRLFVMPSHYEGFGLPLLEAMACGAPVAAARASSLPEVGGEVPAWFDPRDPVDLARVLMECLESPRPDPAAALEQAANFSWRRTADGIMDILVEAASSKAGRVSTGV